MRQDVAAGRVRRSWRAKLRAARHEFKFMAFALPRVLAVMSPRYTPRKLRPLPAAERFLAGFAPAR